uniref:UBC core domain-containing protein n=1 Tax=Neolamprologus brichardi TaxID=32507 RepID=A0A3Q4FYR8_NEOBR
MAQNRHHVASSQKALMLEMKSLQDEPVEGFKITLVDESDLYNWEVAIFGPPNTHYEGVTNSARLLYNDFVLFPPNAKPNGDVCISILHPPVDDPQSGELPSERWNPTQNVRTILLSVISLLNEPNTFSPANVDASVMYRKWRDNLVSVGCGPYFHCLALLSQIGICHRIPELVFYGWYSMAGFRLATTGTL